MAKAVVLQNMPHLDGAFRGIAAVGVNKQINPIAHFASHGGYDFFGATGPFVFIMAHL